MGRGGDAWGRRVMHGEGGVMHGGEGDAWEEKVMHGKKR